MNSRFAVLFSFAISFFFPGCQDSAERNKSIIIAENGNKKFFGTIGTDTVYAYTLKNNRGLKAVVSNYGATLLELWTQDRSGNAGNIILGFDSLAGYLQKGNPYFGAVVGRYANRINHATFSLDGKTFTLVANDRGNTLHGGLKGFDKVIWTVNQVNDSSLALSYSSPNGEEGFPGNLVVKVVYTVNAANGLQINYAALSDQKTPVNLTNHAYFNLSAGEDTTVLNEELIIRADQFTPVNEVLIPTGQLSPVTNTPMDFLSAKKIGSRIDQVRGGYDHNYVLNKKDSSFSLAAIAYDPGSGRKMEVWTTQPGLQFYTGNFLNGSLTGRHKKKIVRHGAFCLETQHFPDSPNQPGFPNTILEPGQAFHERTVYQFSVKH